MKGGVLMQREVLVSEWQMVHSTAACSGIGGGARWRRGVHRAVRVGEQLLGLTLLRVLSLSKRVFILSFTP